MEEIMKFKVKYVLIKLCIKDILCSKCSTIGSYDACHFVRPVVMEKGDFQ